MPIRGREPVYPSFTLVITTAEYASFRLPAYRSSHMGRYHPYPRPPARSVPDYLMQTVDYRYLDESSSVEVALSECTSHREDDTSPEAQNLNHALHPALDRKRSNMSSLIIDLALAIRRSYRRVQSVKDKITLSKENKNRVL